MVQRDKFISLLTGPPTAETDMVVQLPEGNYAARAVLGSFALSPETNEPIVEITMREGHKIPVGGSDQYITAYAVRAPTFNKALEELIFQVRSRRRSSGLTPPPFASSVEAQYPEPNAPGWSMVRLRRLDGTAAQVPAGTKVIPLKQGEPPQHEARIPMTASLRSSLYDIGVPIERYAGRWVMYEPTPGAAEVHEARVEGEPGPTAG